jgi:hypothetical protein
MNLFKQQQPTDLSDHHLTLPGLDIVVCPTIKTVFLVDQTGSANEFALSELQQWCEKQGYFLHGVTVSAPDRPKE